MLNAKLAALAALIVGFNPVFAQVGEWGQCGIGWTGSTTCQSPWVCTTLNPYYFQCLPGTATATTTAHTTTTTARTTTTTARTTTSTTTHATTTTQGTTPPPTGYVGKSGQKFTLNGSTYIVVGANAYWMAQLSNNADIDKAFSDLQSAGFTTLRTWGFNDVTSASGTYYQLFQGSTVTFNTGASGIQKFDYVVSSAKAHGIRLIVTLTNNWTDYGGMDLYTAQLVGSGQTHDVFYTNSKTQAQYKTYLSNFIGHYKSEPGIMAWELANEPRCKGSSTSASASCKTTTVTQWISTMSAYIKSIDSNHLVAVGDEGFFNEPSNPSYPYQGSEGVDFNANLAVSSIDFGTFHSYPEGWGQSSDPSSQVWGDQWITDHATSQISANKPVIIEEFGVTSNQATVYTSWLQTVNTSGLTGWLIWQAGSHLSTGDTPNDGYAEYPDGAVYPILKSAAASLKARG